MKVNGTPRILYVAYPLLTVSRESAGGAEQILWTLEREMAAHGVDTTVAASAGSRVSGKLLTTGLPCDQIDDLERRSREHHDKIIDFVRCRARDGRPFSLIHDKSGIFWPHAAEVDLPVLATLHLPRTFYPPQDLENVPANVSCNCVSVSQARSFSDLAPFQGVVGNGIALDLFEALGEDRLGARRWRNRRGLLWLGRICEEKAPHLALDIALDAGLPITVAGHVYPFSYHQKYFEREIVPRLRASGNATFIPLPSHRRKRQLLRGALAVLITSQVDETSSLVAMEAAASATPVIALARGALREIVRDRVTGFVVDNVATASAAVRRISEINPSDCLRQAREHFGSATMAEGYARLYARVLDAHNLAQGPVLAR
jgi:glycosyltransferase involved in cell wall biosynthesis